MVLPLPKLRVAGRELASFARQAWLMRHDVARPVVPVHAQDGDHVVVCLHGLFTTAGVLRPLRRRLERHAGVLTATLSYPVGPGVSALAQRLAQLTGELPDGVHLHLVGHSAGGIVARHYADQMGDPRVVQTISMAAPFAGVRHASMLGLPIARDLDPSSPLLRQLLLRSRRSAALPHLSLVAEQDQVVRAPIAHALPGGEVTLIRDCGHNSMLFDDRVAERIERRVVELVETLPGRRAG